MLGYSYAYDGRKVHCRVRVIITDSPAEVARISASRVARSIRATQQTGRDPVIGVATGSSPLGTYANLAGMVQRGELDVSRVTMFALDEYVGLPLDHPESYHTVIRTAVTEPLGLDPSQVHVPNGEAPDLDAACSDYEQRISSAGGIDLQLLGIGTNGHLGFNEPTSSFASRTRKATLTPQTREDNARFFSSVNEVPIHCVTQGLGTILDARSLLMVAQGEVKADAVARTIEGPITSMCPGSALQLHADATVVLDRAAASKLKHGDYYKLIEANRRD